MLEQVDSLRRGRCVRQQGRKEGRMLLFDFSKGDLCVDTVHIAAKLTV